MTKTFCDQCGLEIGEDYFALISKHILSGTAEAVDFGVVQSPFCYYVRISSDQSFCDLHCFIAHVKSETQKKGGRVWSNKNMPNTSPSPAPRAKDSEPEG